MTFYDIILDMADGSSVEKSVYKRVAAVEQFFDIIYTVHVETEAKNGKHAGQKRTYRAITEKYAFLPREAVTKFLLQCTECQKRGSPGGGGDNNLVPVPGTIFGGDRTIAPIALDSSTPSLEVRTPSSSTTPTSTNTPEVSPSAVAVAERFCTANEKLSPVAVVQPFDINFSLPFTTTYLRRQEPATPTTNGYSNGRHHDFSEQSSPLSLASDLTGTTHEVVRDETSSNGNREDEEDDDDDSEDKMDPDHHRRDPERLKAFNMFVRLFVDENLDRTVPISKQPKEKIQAIIDSCTRQFPEFAKRARKRIRTYLKSCRRNSKRSRDSNGWESSRSTPAHLTSVEAEQILAQACENESENAKRMRMGLEPVSQPLPISLSESQLGEENAAAVHHHSISGSDPMENGQLCKVEPVDSAVALLVSSGERDVPRTNSSTSTIHSSPPEFSLDGISNNPNMNGGRISNGNGVVSNMSSHRPNFGQTFSRTATTFHSSFSPDVSPLPNTNGESEPTDLSTKPNKPLLSQKLSAKELATVRQMVTGYRESAAFLMRSADELEQLLIQQQ